MAAEIVARNGYADRISASSPSIPTSSMSKPISAGVQTFSSRKS